MAITNATLIRFSNERARVMADLLGQAYYYSKLFADLWDANNGDVAIPNSASEIVQDGSDVDGRVTVSGADLHNLKARADELVALFEANTNEKLGHVLSVAVNPVKSS